MTSSSSPLGYRVLAAALAKSAAYGRSLLAAVDAAAARTLLGLGLTSTKGWSSGMSVCFHAVSSAQTAWSNMPLADALLFDQHRHITLRDLTGYTQVRLLVNKQGTAGASGSKLALRYATSYSTTVGSYSTIGTSAVEVAFDGANVFVASSWVTLAAGATGDCYLAVVGYGGDGAIDPQVGGIHAEFR